MAESASYNPLALQESGYSEQVDAKTVDPQNSFRQTLPLTHGTVRGDNNLDHADATVLAGLQVWSSHSPWRIAAGWSAIAGLLSTGLLTNLIDWQSFLDWRLLALMLLLVDPLWGSIWRFSWGRDGLLPLRRQQNASRFWMPYLRPDSPAGRLLGMTTRVSSQRNDNAVSFDGHRAGTEHGEHEDFAPLLFRVGLPTVLLSLGVAATLHSVAVWFTIIIVACTLFGWLGRRTWGNPSTILQVIVTISLPWILVITLVHDQLSTEQIAATGFEARQIYSICLLILWTVHCLGIALARRSSRTIQQQSESSKAAYDREVQSAIEPYMHQESLTIAVPDISNYGRWVAKFSSQPSGALLIIADIGMVILMLSMREPLWLAILTPLWLPTWLAYHQNQPVDRQPIWRLVAFLLSAFVVGQTPLG